MCRPGSGASPADGEPDGLSGDPAEPADQEEPDPPCQPASQSDSTNWDDRPTPEPTDEEPGAPSQPDSVSSPTDEEPGAPPGNPAPDPAAGVGFQEACRPVPGPGSAGSGDRGSSLWLGRRYWPALGPEAGLAYEAAASGAEDS